MFVNECGDRSPYQSILISRAGKPAVHWPTFNKTLLLLLRVMCSMKVLLCADGGHPSRSARAEGLLDKHLAAKKCVGLNNSSLHFSVLWSASKEKGRDGVTHEAVVARAGSKRVETGDMSWRRLGFMCEWVIVAFEARRQVDWSCAWLGVFLVQITCTRCVGARELRIVQIRP